MDAIGGYFELELAAREEYHRNALRLNSGRNCLEYILRVRNYSKVFIPYYTCEVLLEPFDKLGIAYEFYHISNHLELVSYLSLKEDEALLYTNYFGLKQRYVELLAEKYGKSLIVDNTQAFYAKPIPDIDTFYTCRKFFGVPDGAYLYCDKPMHALLEQDHSYDRMTHLLKRIDMGAETGYDDFRMNDNSLGNQSIRLMSKLTRRMMESIDYENAAKRRRFNYAVLQDNLGSENMLVLPLEEDAVPLVYPYLSEKENLRERLISNKIFVARYWPNVMEWCNSGDVEFTFASMTQFLPIDQRYNKEEMNKIIRVIKQ